MSYETRQSKNGALFASDRKMRQAAGVHSLAKAVCRSTSSIANKEQSGHDSSKERERDGLWNRRLQRKKRRNLSRFSQVAETLRRQADRWDRLGACFVNSRYPGGQASARLPSKWTCRCGTLSPASGPQLITTR